MHSQGGGRFNAGGKGSDKDEREREVRGKKQRDGGRASCLVTEAEGEEGERR